MNSFSLPLTLFAVAFAALTALADAAPVTARYLRFEGYSTTAVGLGTGRIRLYEIEAFANGVNVARTAAVTANSVFSGLSALNDGSLTGVFSSNNTSPGPPSEASPHWIQMDFGSAMPVDKTNVHVVGSDLISFGLFLSNDGVSWTQYARYNQAGGTVQSDPSAPFVVIQSAAMRPGTTLMDVVYRVNDPDDATVKTRALAFVDGVRSFANVIRPVTFSEGTAANLGDAIPSNINHTLTWDVGADWDVDLGQVKFEVLAMDGRGLMPFDWITIPAAAGKPELTISRNSPTDAEVLNALFWLYASGDPGLVLLNGVLTGNENNGVFNQTVLAVGDALQPYSAPFVFKRMNLDPMQDSERGLATAARSGLVNPQGWHAVARPYSGVVVIVALGDNSSGQLNIPAGLTDVSAIAAGGSHSLALKSDGTVVGWGDDSFGQSTYEWVTEAVAIAAGYDHSVALTRSGSVRAWGKYSFGYSGAATAIAAGHDHGFAVIEDGKIAAWGSIYQQTFFSQPIGAIAVATGSQHYLTLKGDGTIQGWGSNSYGQVTIPPDLNGVIAIAARARHSLALKNDGTVACWGSNFEGESVVPAGLNGVIAIAAGERYSLALKNDGTVVGWGFIDSDQKVILDTLTGVSAIAAGRNHILALKAKAP